MKWSMSVLSARTADTHPSLVVAFDSGKYIFNVGENTTRAFLQSHRGWKRARAIFLTRLDAKRVMGLPGFLMTLADGGIKHTSLVGPQGLVHFLATTRLYFYRDTISVNPIQVPPSQTEEGGEPVYKDENLTVYALQLDLNNLNYSPSSISAPSDTSRKRKRSEPPPLNPVPQSFLSKLANLPHLEPERLRGIEREWWRWVVVGKMFKSIGVEVKAGRIVEAKIVEGKERVGKKQKTNANKNQSAGETIADVSTSAGDLSGSTAEVVQADEVEAPLRTRAKAVPGWWKRLPTLRESDAFTYPSSVPPADSLNHAATGSAVSYVLVGPRVRGKFNAVRADELGLGPGPARAKVARGETVTFTVTLPDGRTEERTVRPEDCIGSSEAPGVIFIFDIATPAYIPLLLGELRRGVYKGIIDGSRTGDYNVHTVVHMCGDGVVEDEGWKQVIKLFSDQVHHLVSSSKHSPNPVTFTSAAYVQMRLNELDEDMFPMPKFHMQPEVDLNSIPTLPKNVEVLRANTLVQIRPPRAPSREQEAEERDSFHPRILDPEANPVLSEQTKAGFEQVKEKVRRQAEVERVRKPGDDVLVVPLGTSSAAPTKYRNVSGMLIKIPKHGSILLDAGEGTYGQLARAFGPGPEGMEKVLRELRCIFISHAHADHHIGLARVLAERAKLMPRPDPLYLVAGHPVLLYLSEYADLEALGLRDGSVLTVLSDTLLSGEVVKETDAAQGLYKALGLTKLETVSVRHRVRCYGCVVKHQDGWSVVYSGDTMPSAELVTAGKNATLLIHEATMADEEADLAFQKAHSTIGQAVDVGKQMNAQNILLTHFSARYPKMPPSLTKETSYPTIAVAFDNARIRIGDMWKLNTYLPAIQGSFAESPETVEDIVTSEMI